ncbi:MBL fold metallo-hydrolase [Lysinibacillus sp. LZ02]|uniref:MBL fold metallo-hydrolase n=1 Tax=Lysinibacillus sp. LZ02 TaxID=3420668 RepID=UPI003D3600D6
MEKLQEGLYSISIPTSSGQQYCYLLQEGEYYTLVDVGPNTKATQQVWAHYFQQGLKVNRLIVTNPTSLALAQTLRTMFQAPIFSINTMEPDDIYLRLFDVKRKKNLFHSMSIDEFLTHGQLLTIGNRVWEVIHTPGLSKGDFVLYDAQHKLCLAGRILVHDMQAIMCTNKEDERLLAQFFNSIQMLLRYDIDYALSTKDATIKNVHQVIYTIQNNYLQLLRKVYDLLYKETTVEKLAKKLFHEEATSTLALLHYLTEIGKAEINRETIPYTFRAKRQGFDGMSYLVQHL